MSKNKGVKKTLAVFLAALMVMSCWVFTPVSLKAEAANGSYWLNVKVNVTNKADKKENIQDSYWTITYRTNNGRGEEATMKYDLRESAYGVLSNQSNNQYIHVSVPGFPTKMYYYHDATWNDKVHYKLCDIYVASSSQNGGTWVLSPNKNIESGGWGNSQVDGNFSWDSAGNYPYVATSKTPSAATTPSAIGIPPLGDMRDTSTSSTTAQYYSTDQYGVRYEPTSYSVSGVNGLSTSGGTNGSAYTVTASDSTTASTTAPSQTATITMTWRNDKSNATQHANTTVNVTVYNPRYKVTYNGNGGNLGTNYTWVYKNQKVGATTSTETSNNVEGLTAEKLPTAGLRDGYTFAGIYTAKTGGIQKTANDTIASAVTWFAHWTANKYDAVFKGYRGTFPNAPYEFTVATVATDMDKMPTAPFPEDYDDGDYHYTFNNTWKNSAGTAVYQYDNLPVMTPAGATYYAQYERAFVEADYSGVTAQQAEAARVMSNPNYERIYTLSSRNNLQAALDAVITGKGRTQQDVVDGYAKAIKDAIDALEGEKYSVIFVDGRDNSIIKFIYPTVFGDSIAYPENPAGSYDKNYHYTFKEWVGTANETNLSTVEKNITIIAKFDRAEHRFTEEHIDSSCVKQGGTKYTCACGYTYTEYSGTTGDHSWSDEWTVDTEPTCTQPGSKSHHCTLCGAKKDETVIDALGHDYTGVDEEIIVPVSCENDGVSIKECTRCGYNDYTTIPKLDHKMVDTVTAPTCTSKGYTTSVCENCGKMLIGSFTDPVDHNYVKKDDECVAPSCVGVGYDVSYCSECGLKKYDIIPAVGHDWADESTIDIEPTCTTKGQKSIHCSVCGVINEDSIEEIPANGHTFDDGEELIPATCEQDGVKVIHCTVDGCGYTKNEVLPALGHDWNAEKTVDVPATCTTAGSQSTHCARCNETKGSEEIPALGHDITTTHVDASCLVSEKEIDKCSRCDYEKTREISPALDHNFVAVETVPATCGNAGYTRYECSRNCGVPGYTTYDSAATGDHDWDITYSEPSHGVITVIGKCKTEGCNATFEKEVNSTHKFQNVTIADYTPATCSKEGSIKLNCGVAGCTENHTLTLPVNPDAHKSVTTAVNNPTCTEKGVAVTTCDECHKELARVEIPATGHSFTTKLEEKAATCAADGYVKLQCANCDETTEITLEKNPNAHKFVEKGRHDATCTSAAYTEYECEYCHTAYNDYKADQPAIGHKWGEWTTTKKATNTEDGEMQRVCENDPSHVETLTIPKGGHEFDTANPTSETKATCTTTGKQTFRCTKHNDCGVYIEVTTEKIAHTLETIVTPATCEADGKAYSYCTVCKQQIGEAVTIAALGHDYNGEETVITPATCTTAGSKTVKCTRCDASTEVEIPKLGHSYVEKSRVEPTCTETGYITYVCENDESHTYNALLDKLGHTYDSNVVTDPTCTEQGYTTHHCAVCGNDIKDTYTDALGHDFSDEGEVVHKGNCAEQTVVLHHCQREGCDATKYEYTGTVSEHVFGKTPFETAEATCTEDGYDLFKCEICGFEKKVTTSPALGHNWGYWKITKYPTTDEDGNPVNGMQERECLRCGKKDYQEIIDGKFYLVTFYNHDGTRLLPPAYYAYGTAARTPDFTPTRVADTGYTYTFREWNFSADEINCVTKRMAIIAQYDAHERSYAVTYQNEDGTVLQTISKVKFSQITTAYTAATPTKASDEYYDYTFASWTITCNSDDSTAVATATFTAKLKDSGNTPDSGKPGLLTGFFAKLKAFFKMIFDKIFGKIGG